MARENSKKKTHVWRHHGGPMYVDRNDGRYADYRDEQKRTGVSPDETWNLDMTIAAFALPRLRMFKERTIGIPCCFGSMDEWHAELDRMIEAMELLSNDQFIHEDEQRKIEEGLASFCKYFQALWW